MSNPTVCCICLTRDRPEMLKRAVASFRAQTYENKKLLVLNTGDNDARAEDVIHVWLDDRPSTPKTIGALRNYANSWAQQGDAMADAIAHMDDDDWSHPNRLTEQVALLQASGAECVGYREMLFWDTSLRCQFQGAEVGPPDTAWLYTRRNPSYALGTSFCYWRSTWERRPFEDAPRADRLGPGGEPLAEDHLWLAGVKCVSVSSVQDPEALFPLKARIPQGYDARMVASIHGHNTASKIVESASEWRRVAAWDEYCRSKMEMECV